MDTICTPSDTRPLKCAVKYSIAPDGNVWRDGKSLRQQFKNGRWYAQVYRDDGTKWVFDSDKMVDALFGDSDSDHLTREDILERIGARILPDWPRYAATSYGAVYCIDPPVRGRHAGRCYALATTLKRNRTYVTLYDDIGRRRYVSVDTVIDMVSS
jgi:hypothetical protein